MLKSYVPMLLRIGMNLLHNLTCVFLPAAALMVSVRAHVTTPQIPAVHAETWLSQ